MREIVSIIIPTYNSSSTLEDCLKSIKKQSYLFYEILIIDNYSTDATVNIAKESGVRILMHQGNQPSARNVGVLNSRGDYILFLDSDHILKYDVIRKCLETCTNKGVEMVIIPEVFFGSNFWGASWSLWKNSHPSSGIPRFFIKKYVVSAGLLREDIEGGEDFEFYLRLKKLGMKEAYCSSYVLHNEPSSIRKIIRKELRYSKFISKVLLQMEKGHTLLTRNFLSTLIEVLRRLRTSPLLVVGCLFLLFLKVYVWGIRLVTLTYLYP